LPENTLDSKELNPVCTPNKQIENQTMKQEIESQANKEEENFKDHQLSIRNVEFEKKSDHTFDAESKNFERKFQTKQNINLIYLVYYHFEESLIKKIIKY
jgi:hypothetical protein